MTLDLHSPEFNVTFEPIRRARDRKLAYVEAELAQWACEGKKAYQSEKKARMALRYFRLSAGHDVVAYRCPFAQNHWHLGNGRNA